MSKHANPVLIGAFVLGAMVLGTITVMLLAGGQWFQERRQHVMYFDGAAQGLQEGASVVFLGVKVGTVKRIQLGLAEPSGQFLVAVTIEVEPNMVRTRNGEQVDLREKETVSQLVARGLRARLRMQSLLTGQLYVDLDFHPDKPARMIGLDPGQSEIPTIPTTVDELTSKLEGFPMDTFFADIVAITQGVKKILATPSVQELPDHLQATLIHLESLIKNLDALTPPLLTEARSELAETHKALVAAQTAVARMGGAADRVGATADRLGAAADRVGSAATSIATLTSPESPVMKSLVGASDELANTAKTMRDLTEEDSPTVHDLSKALAEIGRAARALRELAETIDQQPEAIIRGKRGAAGL